MEINFRREIYNREYVSIHTSFSSIYPKLSLVADCQLEPAFSSRRGNLRNPIPEKEERECCLHSGAGKRYRIRLTVMTDVDERTFHGADSDKGCKLEKKSRRRREVGTDGPLLFAPARNRAPSPLPRPPRISITFFQRCDISARARPAREKRQGMRNERIAALGQIFLPKGLVPLMHAVHFGS